MNALRTAATAVALLALLSVLAACSDRSTALPSPPAASNAPQTALGRSVEKAMTKARSELASKNIELGNLKVTGGQGGMVITTDDSNADGRPKAEITPQGDLLIEGRKVQANTEQHALLLQYRKQVESVANAGMDIGVAGADLGMKAATEAIKGVFSGNTDDIEQRVQAEADKIKLSAHKLCDQLPRMLDLQTKLAAAMPEFKPYATMDQSDIDDCFRDDAADSDASRRQAQQQVRGDIRQTIRESIRGAARQDANTDAAAEAQVASAEADATR